MGLLRTVARMGVGLLRTVAIGGAAENSCHRMGVGLLRTAAIDTCYDGEGVCVHLSLAQSPLPVHS